jgi:hypothetical protein
MPPTALPPLEKLDPARAWQPWEPDARDPWNLKWAGHLYRRAGFGAGAAELRQAVDDGLAAALQRLLDGEPQSEQRYRFLTATGDSIVHKGTGNPAHEMRVWWLYCMLYTPHPLREKMTLFWHNHFATSIAKVQRPDLMYEQNKLFRRHALGKFGPFLLDVSKDPAMIFWLDNNTNVKGKPNENYAREIMELFSLGVGNYTEKDVRQAARAFTGWHTNGGGDAFEFDKGAHDEGPKTVLGQTGAWNGDDVVRILLEQPAAARFLVRKLYRFLISEAPEPPAALLEPLAESFRKSDYDVAALVKTMLRSRLFFSEHAYRRRIKSPVEFVLGAVRAVVHTTPDQADEPSVALGPVLARLDAMGQKLFAPPNVKGWPGGRSWLNTATVLARNNFVQQVAFGRAGDDTGSFGGGDERFVTPNAVDQGEPPVRPDLPAPDETLDPADVVHRAKADDPAKVVDCLVDLFLQGGIARGERDKLVAFVAEGKPQDKKLDRRIRECAHAIMCMPEYQLA